MNSNKLENIKKPELLAPGGNLQSAVTALDSGADAVYIGMKNFNARERAENFSTDDASKLINYAHSHDKKVYIALNTLIKESELFQVTDLLAEVANLSPDAIIVQDIGLLSIIKRFFPQLTVHASTQMAIHNSAGIKTAAEMGISRVILERQVTIEEIKIISSQDNMETEVFIQGALCCSLSGQCLFSSWIGGRSGNRGRCTQPCRRRFYSKSGNGFFFSPKDLGTINEIPELIKAGVSSFKIEGRLKKPDYISNVLSAYRLIIDANPNEVQSALKEARTKLNRTAGRQISSGFLHSDKLKDLIEYKKMGVTGIFCGKVIKNHRDGFEVSVTKKIHTGDILRIQEYAGDSSSALAVSAISVNGKSVTKALNGEICFIKCSRPVPANASVYKTGESYSRHNNKLSSLKRLRERIDLQISITRNSFQIETQFNFWNKKLEFAEARKHALSKEKVCDTFMKSNSDYLESGNIDVNISDKLFIPDSVLKQIRREFWEFMHKESENFDFSTASTLSLKRFTDDYKSITSRQNTPTACSKHPHISCGKEALPLEYFHPRLKEVILPSFCPENKLKRMDARIKDISNKFPKMRFRVTSLYQFALLSNLQNRHDIIVSYPCPVCNIYTINELNRIIEEIGAKFSKAQAWIELEKNELFKLIKNSQITIEIFSGGRIPLMSTRAYIPVTGNIHDDRGAEYLVEKDEISGLTYIYANRALKIPKIKNAASFSHCTSGLTDKTTSDFNYNREF